MATPDIIGARAFEADTRTLDVLDEHAPEAAEKIRATLGGVVPAHQPEHALFLSEAVAALAKSVATRKRGRPRKGS